MFFFNAFTPSLVAFDSPETQILIGFKDQNNKVYCKNRKLQKRDTIRAIWVTRFDFISKEDVQRIISQCAEAGFNTVHFQVRGEGTTLFRSSIEPMSERLGVNGNFDPLAEAIKCGRAKGVEIHAWINVMPGWKGPVPPSNPNQLYNKRPDWFWYDQFGKRQPLHRSFYVSVNPCLPEVRHYLVDVFREVVKKYDVDGIHLDYVRFPNEESIPWGSKIDYPRDERTLALYRSSTGLAPGDNEDSWREWRADCVTSLVRGIREMVDKEKPKAVLSIAVCADPNLAKQRFYQDSQRWLDECLVDYVYPMNYTPSAIAFTDRLHHWCTPKSPIPGLEESKRIVMGVDMGCGSFLDNAAQIKIALSKDACAGFAAFSYANLFDSRGPSDVIGSSRKEQKRVGLVQLLREEITSKGA